MPRQGTHTFTAPTTGDTPCPQLSANTTYFAVLNRANDYDDAILVNVAQSNNEDAGSLPGWSLSMHRAFSFNQSGVKFMAPFLQRTPHDRGQGQRQHGHGDHGPVGLVPHPQRPDRGRPSSGSCSSPTPATPRPPQTSRTTTPTSRARPPEATPTSGTTAPGSASSAAPPIRTPATTPRPRPATLPRPYTG